MSIKAIFFDVGGVLVRTLDRGPRARLAARLGMTYAVLDELVFNGEHGLKAQRGELSADEHWEYVCREVGWPYARRSELEAEFFGGDVLDQELVEAVRGWHGRYKTGIISNALGNLRATIENQWHMADAFDVIIVSAEVGVMKPDPRIFQTALQPLAVQPAEAVFVDDFAHNVEGARQVGMQAIQFHSPEQVLQELAAVLQATR